MADELTVNVTSLVPAPPERAFEALTEPGQIAQWWGPAGFICPEVSFEPRAGGAYRIAMQPPDGELFHLGGEIVEFEPPERLAYTFAWEPPDPDDRENVARLSLAERGDSTEVAVIHGPFATEARRDLHRAGWTDTLARLTAFLQRPA